MSAHQIAAIGACGQMHGTVLLDSAGQLVEDKALLWNDKRSQPQVDAFIVREDAERWLRHLNNPQQPHWLPLSWRGGGTLSSERGSHREDINAEGFH